MQGRPRRFRRRRNLQITGHGDCKNSFPAADARRVFPTLASLNTVAPVTKENQRPRAPVALRRRNFATWVSVRGQHEIRPVHAAIIAALAGYAAGTQVAWSQDEAGGLEEIIVTATFRETNVQDTPIAITAVNAEMLDARSQTNLAQITAQTPNVSLRPAGSAFGNALVAFIRGIGQTDFNPSVEPGVGIYVDDVYYSTITGNVLDLLDLERVEVLRGPQGTLAGRNAIGGAIKLFTRKPDGEQRRQHRRSRRANSIARISRARPASRSSRTSCTRVSRVSRDRSDGYVSRLDYACAHNLPPPGQPGGLPTYVQTAGDAFGCELGTEGGQSYASGRFALPLDAVGRLLDRSRDQHRERRLGVAARRARSQARDHSGSRFRCMSQRAGRPPIPNPAFNPTSNSITFVPIYFDNNNNGTYQAGIDVPFDNRFATGGTYTNYATYINDGRSTPSPLFQGGTAGGSTVFKPYVIEPVNTLDSWDYTINLNWQITDNVSLLCGHVPPRIQERLRRGHGRFAAGAHNSCSKFWTTSRTRTSCGST